MSTEIDGEELLCESCDADDGYDERDDVTRMDGDSFEVAHGGGGGEKEKTLPKTVETTTYNKPDGSVNAPDARMAEPSSKRSTRMTSSACSYEGSTLLVRSGVKTWRNTYRNRPVSCALQVGDGQRYQSKP